MFLSSYFAAVTDLFLKYYEKSCTGRVVTFIPTASLVEEVNFYVSEGKDALEEIGLIVDELDISTASKEEIERKVQENDIIYIAGGNTFFLLQELKRTGADKIIKEQIESGKMYVGESAGSIVVSHDIEYAMDLDDISVAPDLDSYRSLGMVDIYPVPHYTNLPFKEAVDEIISKYSKLMSLCPISNTQAIIINDDRHEIWSTDT